ncbi:MAG: acetyltransferase [Cellvibrio sp.]|uniref:acetyltransferase n=1 Tax=Cellvibrio sp. TaxID=1965322 RepID=UPI002728D922|nr:acetyltransferase [Cellvibrio sp.]
MTLMSGARREKGILIFGASGHAKVVIDIVEKAGLFSVCTLADDDPALRGAWVYDYEVMGGKSDLLANRIKLTQTCSIVAIGNNRIRTELAAWLVSNGSNLCVAIFHPSAQVARGVSVGDGSVVMAGVVINSDTRIGRNVIVNTGAIIDHDCLIGDAAHVAPGATLCGGIEVGERTLIGAGAVLHPNIRIGKDVTIGAGATVLSNVPDGLTVVGTPAKQVR